MLMLDIQRYIFCVPNQNRERVHICAETYTEAIGFLKDYVNQSVEFFPRWEKWGHNPPTLLVLNLEEPRPKGFMMIGQAQIAGLPQ